MQNTKGLQELEKRVAEELNLINFPPENWLPSKPDVLDVAVIGAGMAGLAASFALLKLGIRHLRIFDQNPSGAEGPWITYARMRTLRSTKELTGPAFDFPSLTFQAWYKAQNLDKGWDALVKIPNSIWMDYLHWFGQVLKLPIQNNTHLKLVSPEGDLIRLDLEDKNGQITQYARKVVLATGRDGFGGIKMPEIVKNLPKYSYAHTIQRIDFTQFKGKKIAVIGVGASGFDAVAVALENGAESVDVLIRRHQVPNVNKFAHTVYPGFSEGFYFLPDEMHLKYMHEALDNGGPPPNESLDRIRSFSNFHLHSDIEIKGMEMNGHAVRVETNQFIKDYDFIILATGFQIDGSKQPELKDIYDKILLWKDRKGISPELLRGYGTFPYLGPHFEFIGKDSKSSEYLKNIYCYNFGATVSHALLSSDIPGIGYGAARLARGIAQDFFVSDREYFLKDLHDWNIEEFTLPPFPDQ